jgi:predicted  nucleic acid-binding Zn-ribbon protein
MITYKSVTETDNHTITTVNTQDSYIQNTISDLQNTSQQQQQLLEDLQTQHQRQQQRLDEHTTRANESDIKTTPTDLTVV